MELALLTMLNLDRSKGIESFFIIKHVCKLCVKIFKHFEHRNKVALFLGVQMETASKYSRIYGRVEICLQKWISYIYYNGYFFGKLFWPSMNDGSVGIFWQSSKTNQMNLKIVSVRVRP